MLSLLNKIFKYFIFHLKDLLSPIKTIVKYPHVFIQGKVIISNSNISKYVKVFNNSKISNSKIDSYSYVGINCKVMNAEIGKFCSIAPDVKIGLGIHPTNLISTYPGFYSKNASGSFKFNESDAIIEHKSITIGNDVWIGDGAKIIDGINIGNGVIIAGGSFVTKDVPDYAIVGGVPAKIIKFRFTEDQIEQLNLIKWWEYDVNHLKSKANLFLNSNRFFKEFK
ncbi:CatB-related O-acetyltransferase [Cyclobacterium sp. 1_MG-2023]|uniref:xenobiotic acyltransferase family protein n=1 Tax=Cyclobacterium sp. 1_MG-2023 TaxID=3062681 RepID=UPI0026E18B42|nr:CatB-related O-acetyltransferase [Cyclobacterium sp. 1_MG-2023]MDO6440383.1 CatB-related O-acetyltransferase [Cyclobacterium sp. 1_MG-2023]